MIGLRPKTNALFLERPRLARFLPEEPGYAVWLQAPYGYGKSVLIAQWAARLEGEGWRVVWLGLARGEPRQGLAAALGLPEGAPWGVVLALLGRRPTAVVLEDLGGDEALSPLLKHPACLVILASRGELADPELARLRTQGRLVRLGAPELAFSEDEAAALLKGEDSGSAWAATGGWPLPLHLAALTGELPSDGGLWSSVREGLSDPEWRELLFLSSLPLLPLAAADGRAERLAAAGLVQALEGGYRLHPLLAERLVGGAHLAQMRAAVAAEAGRLPPLARGLALERAGLGAALGALLEDPATDLARQDPAAVLRWDASAGPPRGAVRRLRVGTALCSLGRTKEGAALLLEAARNGAPPDTLLAACKDAVFFLAQGRRLAEAEAVEAVGNSVLEQADPELAGRFLHNCYMTRFVAGDWAGAEATLRRALDRYPAESPWRAVSAGNLAIVRWHRLGDLDGLLFERGRMLETNLRVNPSNVPGDGLQLAELSAFLGRREEALRLLGEVKPHAPASPRWGLEARALRLHLEAGGGADPDAAYAALTLEAGAWEDEALSARVRFFRARTLRRRGEPGAALGVLASPGTGWDRVERALALLALGRRPEALTALGDPPPATGAMEPRLYWWAARVEVGGSITDLETLLGLTLARERVLPGLLPLRALPPGRPELARFYPVAAVLQSGWKAAIGLRLDDVPPLELTLLGRVEARRLGEAVALSGRPRDVLALLALGLPREQIAEALWPEVEPEKSRNNLHVNLSTLRRSFEPWGVPTYFFEGGLRRTACDLWDLEAALSRRDAAAVRRLYRELAPGLDAGPLAAHREFLRERAVACVLEGALSAEAGEAEAALEWVLRHDPLHEDAFSRLLARLVGSGRTITAERRYRDYALGLRRELGLDPDPRLRAMLDGGPPGDEGRRG